MTTKRCLKVGELAKIIGVPAKWVYTAAYNRAHGLRYLPKSQVGEVNRLMAEHGISWDSLSIGGGLGVNEDKTVRELKAENVRLRAEVQRLNRALSQVSARVRKAKEGI